MHCVSIHPRMKSRSSNEGTSSVEWNNLHLVFFPASLLPHMQHKYVKFPPNITFRQNEAVPLSSDINPLHVNEFFTAIEAFQQLARSSLGPFGNSQILKLGVGNHASVLVTCHSQPFLKHIQVQNSLGRILLQSATNHHLLQDFSWEFLFLCTEWIERCKDGPVSGFEASFNGCKWKWNVFLRRDWMIEFESMLWMMWTCWWDGSDLC